MWVKDCNNVWNVSKNGAVEIDEFCAPIVISILAWTTWWSFTLGHCHPDAMSRLYLTSLEIPCWSKPPSCPPCIKQVSSFKLLECRSMTWSTQKIVKLKALLKMVKQNVMVNNKPPNPLCLLCNQPPQEKKKHPVN